MQRAEKGAAILLCPVDLGDVRVGESFDHAVLLR
jgi:hypothetical protein